MQVRAASVMASGRFSAPGSLFCCWGMKNGHFLHHQLLEMTLENILLPAALILPSSGSQENVHPDAIFRKKWK
jgi:hypothetical protein